MDVKSVLLKLIHCLTCVATARFFAWECHKAEGFMTPQTATGKCIALVATILDSATTIWHTTPSTGGEGTSNRIGPCTDNDTCLRSRPWNILISTNVIVGLLGPGDTEDVCGYLCYGGTSFNSNAVS